AVSGCRCRATIRCECRAGARLSVVELSAGFRVKLDIEGRRGKVHALSHPHGSTMRREQRPAPSVNVEYPSDGEPNNLGFVAVGELFCRLLDQGDDVGPIDGYDA